VQKWLSDKDEQIHEIGFVNVENDVNISSESDQERLSGWKRVKTLGYSVATIISGQKYRVIYMIGQDIWVLIQAFAVILINELIVLLQEIFGNLRMIRKNLRPLYDLAESARNLQSEVSTYGAKMEERQLRDLAGELSDIDANRLDKIISVDGKQEELKGLASAINDMLRRIHDAYQSQVQFVSDASHELRTPISVIQGYANLLDRWG
jgi:signal transduction histidine kinase